MRTDEYGSYKNHISVNNPENNLWKLFRILAEETVVPEGTSRKILSSVSLSDSNGET